MELLGTAKHDSVNRMTKLDFEFICYCFLEVFFEISTLDKYLEILTQTQEYSQKLLDLKAI